MPGSALSTDPAHLVRCTLALRACPCSHPKGKMPLTSVARSGFPIPDSRFLTGAIVVQKFTRPLTREVELAGGRLAFTFSEQGIAVRPVGSRRPPREITWGALVLHMTA